MYPSGSKPFALASVSHDAADGVPDESGRMMNCPILMSATLKPKTGVLVKTIWSGLDNRARIDVESQRPGRGSLRRVRRLRSRNIILLQKIAYALLLLDKLVREGVGGATAVVNISGCR